MPDTPATPTAGQGDSEPDEQTATAGDGRGGEAAVLADLAGERDKRQRLEAQVAQLQQAQQAQQAALAKAFGLQPEETSDVQTLAGQISDLKAQFAATQQENAVLAVANQFSLSDEADLRLLRSVTDPEVMRSLAERIARQQTSSTPAPGPRPDLSQGPKGQPAGSTPEADFAAWFTQTLSGR